MVERLELSLLAVWHCLSQVECFEQPENTEVEPVYLSKMVRTPPAGNWEVFSVIVIMTEFGFGAQWMTIHLARRVELNWTWTHNEAWVVISWFFQLVFFRSMMYSYVGSVYRLLKRLPWCFLLDIFELLRKYDYKFYWLCHLNKAENCCYKIVFYLKKK